jgi:hypothetical protein
MKIALLFAGQPRYLDEGYELLYDKILSKYDADCFVHTWWDEELSGKKLEFYPTLTYNRTYFYKKNVLETIMSLYKPKAMMYQKQKDFKIFPANYGLGNAISPYSQAFSVMKVNELKNQYSTSSNTSYDLVIRCRFDCDLIKFNINLEEYIETPFIHTKVGFHSQDNYEYITDQFAISSSNVMDIYCNLYNKIEKYYNEGIADTKHSMTPENLITYHLNSENIKYKNIDPSKFDVNVLLL